MVDTTYSYYSYYVIKFIKEYEDSECYFHKGESVIAWYYEEKNCYYTACDYRIPVEYVIRTHEVEFKKIGDSL